jgi:nitrogen fixation NifU-like protein
VGKIDDADGIGEVGNAKCGDIMRMYLKVDKDSQTITDVKFNTFGCGSAIATSSIATEMIKGKPVSEALELSNKAVVEALGGLPAYKLHCSVLAEEAVKAAVKDYYDKKRHCLRRRAGPGHRTLHPLRGGAERGLRNQGQAR